MILSFLHFIAVPSSMKMRISVFSLLSLGCSGSIGYAQSLGNGPPSSGGGASISAVSPDTSSIEDYGKETANMVAEEAIFERQIIRLRQQLAFLSLQAQAPESIPSDLRTFLSAESRSIEKSEEYHKLLKETLNDLIPINPYQENPTPGIGNHQRAEDNLLLLSEFEEDDDISRTIRAQIAAVRGGSVRNSNRTIEINREIADLEKDIKSSEWNFKRTFDRNAFNGQMSGSDADRAIITAQIAEMNAKKALLLEEKVGKSGAVSGVFRQIQFQQLIIELAMQQRYIHSLITCGFYRKFTSDTSFREEAYASQKTNSEQSQGDKKTPSPSSEDSLSSPADAAAMAQPAAPGLPFFSSVTGLEAFLLTRVKESITDRKSLDSMFREGQLGSVEGLLRKMVTFAKYQPELNTIPYPDRQRVYQFILGVRELGEVLDTRDYDKIKTSATSIAKLSHDAGMADYLAFAEEQTKKARFWAKQAEAASKTGDTKATQSFMNAALNRAPHDQEVSDRIATIQDSIVEDTKLADELRSIVDAENYRAASDGFEKFSPLAEKSSDSSLRERYEELIEKEKSVQELLRKCEVFNQRKAYSDVWISLNEADEGLRNDSRLVDEKSNVSGKCADFIHCFENAREQEAAGEAPLALAWYLSALSESPGSKDLADRVTKLSKQILTTQPAHGTQEE